MFEVRVRVRIENETDRYFASCRIGRVMERPADDIEIVLGSHIVLIWLETDFAEAIMLRRALESMSVPGVSATVREQLSGVASG